MVALRIAAERSEAVVSGGRAASVHLEFTGWTGPVAPILLVAAEHAGAGYPWISVAPSSQRGSTSGAVTFDPSIGPRPRPGTYPVVVSVEAGGQRASTSIRFVIERHPCLQIRPQPSFTWDPLTNSAKLKVALWSCGNVDLDVNWSARLNGRHLEVEPTTVTVFADGGVVDSTLTIKIPEGVDLDTEIDIESLSDAGVNSFIASIATGNGEPSWLRRHGSRLLVAAVIAAVTAAAWPVVASLAGDDESIVSPLPGTTEASVVTADEGTSITAPPTTDVTRTTDSLTSAAANDNPIATADEHTSMEDTTTAIDVLANDSDDDGDTLALISVVGEPGNGTAQVVEHAIKYTPAPDFAGTDTFSYALGDGRGGLAAGTVTVLVEGQPDAPVASDDEFTVLERRVQLLDVLANDTDIDGDELAILRISQPNHGNADLVDDRTVQYVAGRGSTSDRLTYVATDSALESEPATVQITIQPSLVVDDETAYEGTGVMDPIPVGLSSRPRGVIRGTYRTVDDTARSGTDYVGHTGSFEFRSGQRTTALDGIEILRDELDDDDETFDIELTVEYPGDVVDTATITVTIDEDIVE